MDEYQHLRESADAATREPMTLEREAQQAIADGYGTRLVIVAGDHRFLRDGSMLCVDDGTHSGDISHALRAARAAAPFIHLFDPRAREGILTAR